MHLHFDLPSNGAGASPDVRKRSRGRNNRALLRFGRMKLKAGHIADAIRRAEKLRAESEKIRAQARVETIRAHKLIAEVTVVIERAKLSYPPAPLGFAFRKKVPTRSPLAR